MNRAWTAVVLVILLVACGASRRGSESGAAASDASPTPPPVDLGLRYRALLFAAADYEPGSGLVDLRTPQRDIEGLGEVLRGKFGFEVELFDNVTRADLSRPSSASASLRPSRTRCWCTTLATACS